MADDDRVTEMSSQMEKLVTLLERRETDHGRRMDRIENTLEAVTKAMNSFSSSMEKMKMPAVPASPVATLSPLSYTETASTPQHHVQQNIQHNVQQN